MVSTTNSTNEEAGNLVIGAGPAGLTVAKELSSRGVKCIVVESDNVVGGISRTVERNGWRFDIGGHRFFTKVKRVEDFWNQILMDGDFMSRPRLSRIYYKGAFYDYPLKALNALRNLGVIESIRCVLSYAWVRVHPPRDLSTFEGWTASRFGWRLYRIFFKTYTEKVWGVPAGEIQADWAAQRIKNLSLFKAIKGAILPKKGSTDVTSLIDRFDYPKFGPGMLWQECARQVIAFGSEIKFHSQITTIKHAQQKAISVEWVKRDNTTETYVVRNLFSSMPLSELILSLDPPAPVEVMDAARKLRYRDFMTVALVLPDDGIFPDNWIYVHDAKVKVGRIQNFKSWSPYMVKDGFTCLGLEYFVNEGDELWTSNDSDLIQLGVHELRYLNLLHEVNVSEGYVVRMPKAYPMYDGHYRESTDLIRTWLDANLVNVYPIGRNGMHRYNNQDHSMLTAMLSVEKVFGAEHDIWSVNVDDDYHEEVSK